ncbi:MAG: rhodanese-related sulfurtransferase, partial [Proteobacteria bacterium]|nr:rhodanese-related sulfurtransferase [Pseudomonadota bacterium]
MAILKSTAHPFCNTFDREVLKQKLAAESRPRVTRSFYVYQPLNKLEELRNQLYLTWRSLAVLGRVYIAAEGINAQVSVPEENVSKFKQMVLASFPDIHWGGVVEDGRSFLKLTIKIKQQLVASGDELGGEKNIPMERVGQHLTALEWHQMMDDPNSVTIDVRNEYEHAIGHFEGAHLMASSSHRQQYQEILNTFNEDKQKKILLYCTGGIRCEKTSAFLLQHGFSQVYQLQGGITGYKKEIDHHGLISRFKGKNFVFDDRLGERITGDVISECYTCGKPSDDYHNCAWLGCHTLFIQCAECRKKMDHCCSESCQNKNS